MLGDAGGAVFLRAGCCRPWNALVVEVFVLTLVAEPAGEMRPVLTRRCCTDRPGDDLPAGAADGAASPGSATWPAPPPPGLQRGVAGDRGVTSASYFSTMSEMLPRRDARARLASCGGAARFCGLLAEAEGVWCASAVNAFEGGCEGGDSVDPPEP